MLFLFLFLFPELGELGELLVVGPNGQEDHYIVACNLSAKRKIYI